MKRKIKVSIFICIPIICQVFTLPNTSPHNNSAKYCYPHFINDETKAQNKETAQGYITSFSTVDVRFEPDPKIHAFYTISYCLYKILSFYHAFTFVTTHHTLTETSY